MSRHVRSEIFGVKFNDAVTLKYALEVVVNVSKESTYNTDERFKSCYSGFSPRKVLSRT